MNQNPYEAPQTNDSTRASNQAFEATNFERVRHGAMTACWASLALVLLHTSVPILTKLGWRSPTDFMLRTGLQAAAILWLCQGIRQMRAVPLESQTRHFLSLTLVGWIISLLIDIIQAAQWLMDVSFLPRYSFLFGDGAQFLGKLTLLWAVCRMGSFYQARRIALAAGTAMLLLALTDLPYLVGDLLAFAFRDSGPDYDSLHAQLSLLDVPVHWALYLLMHSAALYSLYALATLPHDATLSTAQDTKPVHWKQEFQLLLKPSGFAWGVSLCWWAMILAIVVPRCCRIIVLLKTPDFLTFSSLAIWSERAGILCQIVALGFLWTIQNERVKPWFAWGAICLFAGASFNVLQFFNGYEMELDTPAAEHVTFIAAILPIVALGCLCKGFLQLADDWQQPLMQRHARSSLLRYSILGAVWFVDLAILSYALLLVFEHLGKNQDLAYGIVFLVHTSLEIYLLLSYIPLLKITANLAKTTDNRSSPLPTAEPATQGTDH